MSDSCCHTPQAIHTHSNEDPLGGLNLKKPGVGKVIAAFALSLLSMGLAMPEHLGLSVSEVTVIGSGLTALAVILMFGRHFLKDIIKIFSGANMNTLIGIAILASFALSIWKVSKGDLTSLYFDTAAFVATFVLLGQYLEGLIQYRMNHYVASLVDLLPQTARRLDGEGVTIVPIGDLKVGDRVQVLMGERVPTDAKLESSAASLDESLLTGESKPVSRVAGDRIIQGALNLQQPIVLFVSELAHESLYARLKKAVNSTLSLRPKVKSAVERFTNLFVPLVVLIALGAGIFWSQFAQAEFSIAVTIALSVLTIACPCALGMATPTALFVGVTRAAKKGILLKSMEAVEKSATIDLLAFDKTGTLTVGEPRVSRVMAIEHFSHRDLISLALSVEQSSEHPYARAIQKKASDEGIKALKADDLHIAPGKGVSGTVKVGDELQKVVVGNFLWLLENGFDRAKAPENLVWEADGTEETVLWVGAGDRYLGLLFLKDPLRPETSDVLQGLKDDGFEIGMITGDAENVAKSVSKDLRLKFVHSQVLPEEKATIVKRLMQPKKKGLDMVAREVAFVGDGVNDAPALAASKLGIAMGNSVALSQSMADIILVSNSLRNVREVFRILSETRSLIRQNLLLSAGYNIIAIPLAAGLLYYQFKILLSPQIAALAMILSSVTVMLNSLRALRSRDLG